MASYLEKICRALQANQKIGTGAQKNILNKGALLGNIFIGGDKVR
jgi:hypothetical protein